MRELYPGLRGVSRETLDKLQAYEVLVRQWSPRINLVSPGDLESLWHRHIVDSAQLLRIAVLPDRWLDLGSGAGFPGIVVAIMLTDSSARVTLVESDKRKCAFLTTASRSLDLAVDVLPQRIETLLPAGATTLSARALAPLDQLVSYASVHLSPNGAAVFPKGRNWKNELRMAKEKWSFDYEVIQSITDRDAATLKLQNIERL